MDEMSEEGYNLRKRMVPKSPPTSPSRSLNSPSFPDTKDDDDGFVHIRTDKAKVNNGKVSPASEITSISDEGEEETVFDGSGSATQPLIEPDKTVTIEMDKTRDESSLSIALQVFIPYIIAGFGTVGAGMVLDVVQHWVVFTDVSEIFILVPSLLGLKGNLEMTLASRLSTQANVGNMDKKGEMWKMIGGNLALVQCQAIVVGFLASLVAMIMGWIPQGKFNISHGLLLCASSMLTAAVASFILGSLMVLVIVLSRKMKINPDNVATPIAASLGDLTTLSLLAGVAMLLYKAIVTPIAASLGDLTTLSLLAGVAMLLYKATGKYNITLAGVAMLLYKAIGKCNITLAGVAMLLYKALGKYNITLAGVAMLLYKAIGKYNITLR
ncbi:hypothetical protein FSP39_003587 [Pinctada imbricata]|uniref:SLC41A/MgtE integral membrane domain-containing protein n=1 Tax=Pinctada imbricata TaxID=66713 RepID=A0AA88Y9Y5_PINIB|nr:hypothetical protein FSP39_003587 [Pinctada imbricata]